jgi:acetyl-CoA hydrolase
MVIRLFDFLHRCSTSLHSRIVPAEATAKYFKDGMKLGFSGFTPTNYPKVVPLAVCDYVEKNNLKGKMSFDLYVGASSMFMSEFSLLPIPSNPS